MRVDAEFGPEPPHPESMISDTADIIFDERAAALRVVIQVVVAATIGMMLGAFGHSLLPF